MSRVADLARGPDRYDRAEIRERLAASMPTIAGEPRHRRPLNNLTELRQLLREAIDRLDDAEHLLEEAP